MVTSLAPNQATVPHGLDMSNVFKCTVANCSNVAAYYLRHLVTIVVLAEWRLGTLAGFSSA